MTPVAGVVPALLDATTGKEITGPGKGLLVIKEPWPSISRTCWGDHKRFEDGYYWITGRVDDVVVVSGHNIGTAEVESALVAHPAVSFCGVPLPFLLRAPFGPVF